MLTTKAKVKVHNDVTNNETIHYLLHTYPEVVSNEVVYLVILP